MSARKPRGARSRKDLATADIILPPLCKGRDAAARSAVKTVHRRLFLAKAAKQLCCEPGVATSVSEAIRVAVGLFKRNCNSYSHITIPHPPAVGAPFRAMWALFRPLSRDIRKRLRNGFRPICRGVPRPPAPRKRQPPLPKELGSGGFGLVIFVRLYPIRVCPSVTKQTFLISNC